MGETEMRPFHCFLTFYGPNNHLINIQQINNENNDY